MRGVPCLWLAIAVVLSPAKAAEVPPPPNYAEYFNAVRKADAIVDDEQRCLAYPDLPDNTWPAGTAKRRCALLRPPLFSLARIDELLDSPQGVSELDRKFSELLASNFSDPAQHDQLFIAFNVFWSDPISERVATRWLEAAPASIHARTAMGLVYAKQGWKTRGGQFIQNTPESAQRAMNALFVKSFRLLGGVLEQEPHMLPACREMAAMGRQSSDTLQQFALSACLKTDPTSFFVVEEWIYAAEPRWGGSLEDLRVVSAYASAHASDNPMLYMLTVDFMGYEALRSNDHDRALATLEPAAKIAPNAGYLRAVGKAYVIKDQDWQAWVYLSQALRFNPQYAQESRLRASILDRFGYSQWALADAQRAVALSPDDGYAQFVLALVLEAAVDADSARPHYLLATRDAGTREAAFPNYCRTWLQAGNHEQSGTCTANLVSQFPENGEAWRLRALSLMQSHDRRSNEAWEHFLRFQDPKRWPRHAEAATQAREILGTSEK